MAQRVLYPDHIEPLVQFVEETTPEHIVARAHDKLAAGTTVKDMLLASALAVVRSSDLPPGHHGGPLHPLAGLHAVRHIAARLPGEYAMLPVIQHVAVANKHIHSPAMGPYVLADAKPVSENDDVEATVKAFRTAVSRGVYNACDHYFLYLLEHLSPMQVLELLLEVGVPRISWTTTISSSRCSPGGPSSTSAGNTRSTSAARRCATSRVRRPRRCSSTSTPSSGSTSCSSAICASRPTRTRPLPSRGSRTRSGAATTSPKFPRCWPAR